MEEAERAEREREARARAEEAKGGHGWPIGAATGQGEMSSGQGACWPVQRGNALALLLH